MTRLHQRLIRLGVGAAALTFLMTLLAPPAVADTIAISNTATSTTVWQTGTYNYVESHTGDDFAIRIDSGPSLDARWVTSSTSTLVVRAEPVSCSGIRLRGAAWQDSRDMRSPTICVSVRSADKLCNKGSGYSRRRLCTALSVTEASFTTAFAIPHVIPRTGTSRLNSLASRSSCWTGCDYGTCSMQINAMPWPTRSRCPRFSARCARFRPSGG